MDGTGYSMSVTLSSQNGPPVITGVWDKSGNNVLAGEDTNGNFFSSTDELGRSPGFAGSTIQSQNIPVYTAFGGNEFNGTVSVISSIALPDGRSYQFTYDQGTTQGHYGQITGITLPTGGQVGFSYINICPGSARMGADRRLTTLSEPGATWTLTYNLTPACYTSPS